MAFLKAARKSDLQEMARFMELNFEETDTRDKLIDIIVAKPGYDQSVIKEIYKECKESREEEARKALELEKLRLEIEAQRLANVGEIESGRSNQSGNSSLIPSPKISPELFKILNRFDPREGDIGLFLVNFERQAKLHQVPEGMWVSHLLGLLTAEMAQAIAREPEEVSRSYEHVKSLLLKRFKLSPERFRQKFREQQRKSGSMWRDFVFEITNSFEEWIKGLNVTTFDQLKALIITDQLRAKLPKHIKEHFIDVLDEVTSPEKLAEMVDRYESKRMGQFNPKSNSPQDQPQRLPVKKPNSLNEREGTPKDSYMPPGASSSSQAFEKPKARKCYNCHQSGHFRYNCPQRSQEKKSETVARVAAIEENFLRPYIFNIEVDGQEVSALRDSGASIDVIQAKYVNPEQYIGRNVWIRQGLDDEARCLPLANVTIETCSWKLETVAAVTMTGPPDFQYIFSNRSLKRLEELGIPFSVEKLAAVTRSQALKAREIERMEEDEGCARNELDEGSYLPPPIELGQKEFVVARDENEMDESETAANESHVHLINVPKEAFIEEQKKCESLTPLFGQARSAEDLTRKERFVIRNDLLVRISKDRRGFETCQIVVPAKYRLRLLALVHDGFAAHLGVTKTKDRLLRHFFWPKCYVHVEQFVKSCLACQKTGKPGEKKKAPLKLVPIISEPFSRLYVDAVGPLPVTPTGNRYIITALCAASKFPDAVPVKDISSVSVTQALMWIFSRVGFPQEVLTDQGSSFVSVLTTTFLEKCGVRILHSSVYHPQSNMVERWHSTVKRVLRTLCYEEGEDWEHHLPAALFALRSVTNESSGFSPAELVYGKNLRGPLTLLYEKWTGDEDVESSVVEYVFNLLNRLRECREIATKNLETVQEKNKKWYDRNAIKRSFKEGDRVMVLSPARPHKLAIQWTGPGTIVKCISETNYLVALSGKREKTNIYHVNMLKPFYERTGLVSHLDVMTVDGSEEVEIPEWEDGQVSFDFAIVAKNSETWIEWTEQQREDLFDLLNEYKDAFSNEPGLTHLVVHEIKLSSKEPVRVRVHRASPRQLAIMKEEIKKMLKMGVIEEGDSDYAAPMILVEVPGKAPRPCIDYRRLNAITETQFFPLPNIEERVEKVARASLITTLDLARGYWQIALSPTAQRYATFVTPFGSYRPLRMPFGLKNAPYFFSRLMTEVLRGLADFAIPYLDDVAIFSSTWSDHLHHLKTVLHHIKDAGLTIKLDKCKFAQPKVTYLGHTVGQGYRKPSEIKVEAIKEFARPTSKTQLRAFLGMCGYYQHYIRMFSSLAAPLTDALKGNKKISKIEWTDEREKSFNALKTILTGDPVLRAPDFHRPFIIQVDASDRGIGVVLSQKDEKGNEHPVLYLSKKLSATEQKYSVIEKECVAIVYAVKKLKCYIDGNPFLIQTDHNPLKWLNDVSCANSRLMRWSLLLQPLSYAIEHRPGQRNANADFLSRL